MTRCNKIAVVIAIPVYALIIWIGIDQNIRLANEHRDPSGGFAVFSNGVSR